MFKKFLGFIIIVIVIIIILGAALYSLNGDDSNVVKIGYLPTDHDAALFVAQAQDLYGKKGIKVETHQFKGGGDLMSAMASGVIDVGYVGITPVLSSIDKGVPIKVVSGVQNEGSDLVVSNGSNITNASDLPGKSVGTPGAGSVQFVLLLYYLKQNNISPDSVDIPAMQVAPMNDALNSNKIEGMLTYEPYGSISVYNGNKLLVNSGDIIEDHPCCVVVASDKFIKNKPDALNVVLEAHENATEYIKTNASGTVSNLPDDIVPNKDVEENVISNMKFVTGLNESYKQNIRDFMQIEIDLGLLKNSLSDDKIFWSG